jgi:hypothetical protein
MRALVNINASCDIPSLSRISNHESQKAEGG